MLKEKLYELLRDEDETFLPAGGFISTDEPTTYDLVGLVLKVAGYALQITEDRQGQLVPKLPLNAPEPEREWVEYERAIGATTDDFLEIPALARQLWAAEYGEKEGLELPFYDRDCRDRDGDPDLPLTERWWDSLEELEAYEVREFLVGEDPSALNGPEEDD